VRNAVTVVVVMTVGDVLPFSGNLIYGYATHAFLLTAEDKIGDPNL
jgi:hypothetical protein